MKFKKKSSQFFFKVAGPQIRSLDDEGYKFSLLTCPDCNMSCYRKTSFKVAMFENKSDCKWEIWNPENDNEKQFIVEKEFWILLNILNYIEKKVKNFNQINHGQPSETITQKASNGNNELDWVTMLDLMPTNSSVIVLAAFKGKIDETEIVANKRTLEFLKNIKLT